ncbi:CRE-ULP-1 protein [Caenorhabditis remanei]|uniref:CRE-ULP-1 protein n=1 Tax=Caenorhabditis remanei TaxID=31234 RepID=E3NHF1_CAERE|nr:CRE-ULP-1 protein [Caenorhabditis remanei]
MFAGYGKQKEKVQHVYEVAEDENADVVVESTAHVTKEPSSSIIFLNAEKPERRIEAGSEEVKIEKHIQRDVEVSDDSDPDEIQEIPTPPTTTPTRPRTSLQGTPTNQKLEKSFEKQQDDEEEAEPDVLFEKIVKTPNKQLENARAMQNEMIYLNETQDDSDGASVTSSINRFDSPGPDDSVSRPITPLSSLTGFPSSSSNSIRDFWRRSSVKKPTNQNKKPGFRIPSRVFHSTSSIQKFSSGIQKIKKSALFSRDRLLQGIVASGQYDEAALAGIGLFDQKQQQKKKTLDVKKKTLDVLARANNKIEELRGTSRSTTPSLSRESSVIYEGSSFRSHTISTSSSVTSCKTNQRIQEAIAHIDSLNIHTPIRGPHRYEKAYESAKLKEDVLLEEARIRQGHRVETRGDLLDKKRRELELRGIVQRPKVEKKIINDFVELPEESDFIIGSAWNRMMDGKEKFVENFDIPICREDLETLSGLHWLNDNVINFYLQMIVDRCQKDQKYPKIYAFNSFFYTNITTKGYASVKRWTRKIDVFSYDIILIPVHLGVHWCLAIIDMKEKKIQFYDSLYAGNTVVLPALKNYVASESMDKKKVPFDFAGWTIEQMEDIPRQQNGSDCGVFTCQFAEWASRRTTPRFTQKNMPYYRKRMVYEIVSSKLLATI